MTEPDPLELLKCLSVFLSPEGGIKSREELPRLLKIFKKFSMGRVSKCVYVKILKRTDVTLVDMFMTSGGWHLMHTWLQVAMADSNWNLVQEMLELLLIIPVDSIRLRLNFIPKQVKSLSKREDVRDVKELATSLVNKWLAIVKNNSPIIREVKKTEFSDAPDEKTMKNIQAENIVESSTVTNEIATLELPKLPAVEKEGIKIEVEDENTTSSVIYNEVSVRQEKKVLRKSVDSGKAEKIAVKKPKISDGSIENKNTAQIIEEKNENESESKSDSIKSYNSKNNITISKSHSSSDSSKNKDKTDFEEHRKKQAEKHENTSEKLKPVTLNKIWRIPKKNVFDGKYITEKPSMSIEPKKKFGERPKTVKIFQSKMRLTGLEEAVKLPPPKRAVKKPPKILPPISESIKRPSSPKKYLSTPPEKKFAVEIPERIGSMKLIPPKPQPFIQALTKTTSRKKPKTENLPLSTTKESEESTLSVQQFSSPPFSVMKYSAVNFYQDTIANSNDNEKTEENKTDEPKEEYINEKTTKESVSEEALNPEGSMESRTIWKMSYPDEHNDIPVESDSISLKRDVQYGTSKNTPRSLHLNNYSILDSPSEPIPEAFKEDTMKIAVDNAKGRIYDWRNTPWPKPKGTASVEQPPIMQSTFLNILDSFFNSQGPRFGPPNMMSNGPLNMMPSNPNLMGNPNKNTDKRNQGLKYSRPMKQGFMNQGQINPSRFGPNRPNREEFTPCLYENREHPMAINEPNMYEPANNNFNNMERRGGYKGRDAFRTGPYHRKRNVGKSWMNGDHREGRIFKNGKKQGYYKR